MHTENKVTELFCMHYDFCKFFDTMKDKYKLKSDKKRHYHRDLTLSNLQAMSVENS